MPLCAACCVTKGFNKFHGGQRHLPRPVCKECFRNGKKPVDLGGKPETLLIRAPGDKKTASLADFQLLSVIGQGAFGKVLLVRHSTTGKVHAMKIISKQFVIDMDSVHYMKTERDVMTKIRHPFVIGLNYAFQTESKVYLVMEYQSGGELFSYLKEEGTFTEWAGRHTLLPGRNDSGFGTPPRTWHYPSRSEARKRSHFSRRAHQADRLRIGKGGYDSAVDWWSLGALAYEMLTGNPPFRSKNPADLHKKILSAKTQLPRWLSVEAHSLIKSLLERNVSKRLGGGKSSMFVVKGVQALKRHPFFKSVDWEKMETLRVPPPMVPSVSDEADTSNFDKKFTDMSASDLLCDPVIEEDNNLFRGFSFCRRDSIKEIISNPQSPINTTLLPTIASLIIDGDDIKDINDAIATAAGKQPAILT
ncbi:hypothetical protein PC117_g10342 [Phytophthora cactorum]|uniref:Protein kinase, ATP binding site n=1 Tax=Phytophthora cactorum TaxID=29920 RepID=A0A8T1DK02_9STRA|nr:hypothetical protein PC117_g10342 [Phytophthora cactorum]KAG3077781.1 hypothetical protein PC122_g12979 [Phytophthora cactorum]KAG4051665.1 hypothetical protein PC123_g13134 [Phytophthora cactorum]